MIPKQFKKESQEELERAFNEFINTPEVKKGIDLSSQGIAALLKSAFVSGAVYSVQKVDAMMKESLGEN